MNRRTGKVIDCSIGEAKARRDQARAYIDVAEIVLADSASRYEAQVAAALAVLAAIAAADAVCGPKLHRYSREQDHAQAVALLETVDVDDPSSPIKLRQIFALCRPAHSPTAGARG